MKRLVAFIAASAGVLLANPVLAQTENCGAELNYDDADIRAVIDEIAVRTGRTFLLDPRVQGRVTVKSPPNGGLCPDEAWELFQAMLRVNGFAATPLGASKYKIVPLQESARAAGPVGEGATGGDLVTQIVRLRFIDAREAAANLSQIINERGVAAPVRSGNSIILVDTADNVERLKAVLAQLDRDPTVYKTIQLANASAAEVARVLKGLAREISEEGGAQSVPVSIVPVEASNSILLRAEPAMIQRLAGVISELDQIGGAKADLSVIPLSHANAEEIAQTLSQFMGPQTAGGDNPDAPPQQSATVSFHRPTNSIIINGDADMQRKMQWLISQLDVRRAQVLIEAIVVEVSDSTARELGLQYFLTGTKGSSIPFATTNFQNVSPNILALAGPTLIETGNFPGSVSDDLKDDITEAALTELLGISGLAFGGAGTIGDDGVFSAILTALKQDERSNVLSSPSIVTVDNQEAELSVGQEIPITTGEAVGDNLTNAFRTIERKEVGVILTVTPQINEGGT
ncbi:MAG: type II secretion system secretin GspD, partial [Parvularculaceae bacterium]